MKLWTALVQESESPSEIPIRLTADHVSDLSCFAHAGRFAGRLDVCRYGPASVTSTDDVYWRASETSALRWSRLLHEILTPGNQSMTTTCAPKGAHQRLNPPPSDRREATTDYAKLLRGGMRCAKMHRHASAFAACYVESDSPSAFRPCSGRETNSSVKQGEIACCTP
jgi:hypothetical protein